MSEKSDLLYNSVSDKFIAIRHEVDLRDISVITPTIFSLLQENGMIVPSNLNEREKVMRSGTPTHYLLIVSLSL